MKIGNERGTALATAIILGAVLLTLALSSLIYSRSDAMVSSNSYRGSEALWIAHLGAERVKDWLRKFDPATGLSNWENVMATGTVVRHNAETYSGQPGATYTTSVAPYGGIPGRFLIDSSGTAPDASTSRIQEIVAIAGASLNADAINIQGFGTHTKLAQNNIGIPNYYIDARDHDLHGTPCGAAGTTCAAAMVSTIAGTQAVIETNPINVKGELTALREEIVDEASCNASGSDCNGRKEAGLYWVESLSLSSDCAYGNMSPGCISSLDLTDERLNAVNHAPNVMPALNSSVDTPWAHTSDMFVGPIVGSPETRILTQGCTTCGNERLIALIEQLLEFAVNSGVSNRVAINTHMTTSRTLGSWDSPVIAIVCADQNHPSLKMRQLSAEAPCSGNGAPNNTDVDGNAVIVGTGLLIVPRSLLIDDATFMWRGIVLILDGGRIEVKATGGGADACGMILGTAILQDDSGADPKIKLLDTEDRDCTNPFATQPSPIYSITNDVTQIHGMGVKYSKDAIRNALTATMTTLAWNEVYAGE